MSSIDGTRSGRPLNCVAGPGMATHEKQSATADALARRAFASESRTALLEEVMGDRTVEDVLRDLDSQEFSGMSWEQIADKVLDQGLAPWQREELTGEGLVKLAELSGTQAEELKQAMYGRNVGLILSDIEYTDFVRMSRQEIVDAVMDRAGPSWLEKLAPAMVGPFN
jgi:hypothetical protein